MDVFLLFLDMFDGSESLQYWFSVGRKRNKQVSTGINFATARVIRRPSFPSVTKFPLDSKNQTPKTCQWYHLPSPFQDVSQEFSNHKESPTASARQPRRRSSPPADPGLAQESGVDGVLSVELSSHVLPSTGGKNKTTLHNVEMLHAQLIAVFSVAWPFLLRRSTQPQRHHTPSPSAEHPCDPGCSSDTSSGTQDRLTRGRQRRSSRHSPFASPSCCTSSTPQAPDS